MPIRLFAALLLGSACLAGCSTANDGISGGKASFSDIGSSLTGGFTRNTDTYGTNTRRMDTYGAVTAPVLPTMGMPGYGK